MMRRVLRQLTELPGVIGAAAFDDDGEQLAFLGRASALAYATACAELAAKVAHRASAPIVPRVEYYDDAVAVAHPLHPGVVVIVAESSFDPTKPIVWTTLAAAVKEIAFALGGSAPVASAAAVARVARGEPLAAATTIDAPIDSGEHEPSSETLPAFTRPPGY